MPCSSHHFAGVVGSIALIFWPPADLAPACNITATEKDALILQTAPKARTKTFPEASTCDDSQATTCDDSQATTCDDPQASTCDDPQASTCDDSQASTCDDSPTRKLNDASPRKMIRSPGFSASALSSSACVLTSIICPSPHRAAACGARLFHSCNAGSRNRRHSLSRAFARLVYTVGFVDFALVSSGLARILRGSAR